MARNWSAPDWSAPDWSAEIGALVGQVRERYLHPDVAEQIGEVLAGRLADGAYRDLADERAFAAAVTGDMQSVNGDLHLFVRYAEREIPGSPGDAVDEGPLRADQALRTGHGFTKVERLDGNVALLDIRKFYDPAVGGAGEAAVAAMTMVASADALLLDLRRNGGGEPDMVMFVSSYLFDTHTHLVDLVFADRTLQYWTAPFTPGPAFGGSKPVWVLTSAATISGGEGMTYQLQQSGRATVVGEVTAGAANFHYPARLSAHLIAAVPSGYPVDPVSGGNWEGTGVQPDVEVPAGDAVGVGYELALAQLRR
jgi:C-terminal processing protease CtpA/Prc